MRVAACIPTRGDQDLTPVIASIPDDWEVVIWDNSQRTDYGVFARYAAIGFTHAPIIYTQDDDVVLEPESFQTLREAYQPDVLTANMPAIFRPNYTDSCLVGFGAIFHRDLPVSAFRRFAADTFDKHFQRTCDVVFTTLTPRHLIDVPKRDLPWASNPERMWKQPQHVPERARMLELARAVRDA